jgi:TonB family protein
MPKPRATVAGCLIALTLTCTAPSIYHATVGVYAQQQTELVAEDTARAIEMYRKGDTKGAIETLRAVVKQRKDDAYAWHYLGLALLREGDIKPARKAFETAIKLKPGLIVAHISLARVLLSARKWRDAARAAERLLAVDPQNAEAHYLIGEARLGAGDYQKALKEANAALSIDPNFAPAFLLKSRALTANLQVEAARSGTSDDAASTRLLKEAADNLERYIKLSPNDPDLGLWREQLETLQIYAGVESSPADQRIIFKRDELTTPAHILYKAEPGYTEEARKNQQTGTVVLRAVLSADGTVKHILAVKSLGYGLTEKCIKAARAIKFIPATKDGHPVSQVVIIEYNFNIY